MELIITVRGKPSFPDVNILDTVTCLRRSRYIRLYRENNIEAIAASVL